MSEEQIQDHQHSAAEEARREKRGRIRRTSAWVSGVTLIMGIIYFFGVPLFIEDTSSFEEMAGIINNCLFVLAGTFVSLCGIDGFTDVAGKMKKR